MIDILRNVICVVSILATASPLLAENTKPPTEVIRTRAEQALTAGDLKLAAKLAKVLLNKHSDDYQALVVLSLAQSQLGQHEAAAGAASRAFSAGLNSDEKMQAARIAGAARFKAGQFTRAEWWLRRAANHAKTTDTIAIVEQEFQAIRQQNPLSVKLSFSVAPSNNAYRT